MLYLLQGTISKAVWSTAVQNVAHDLEFKVQCAGIVKIYWLRLIAVEYFGHFGVNTALTEIKLPAFRVHLSPSHLLLSHNAECSLVAGCGTRSSRTFRMTHEQEPCKMENSTCLL